MTEPSPPRPVPGPQRSAPGPDAGGPFADLVHRPVAEHVAVFEAEHSRLASELSTIDRL